MRVVVRNGAIIYVGHGFCDEFPGDEVHVMELDTIPENVLYEYEVKDGKLKKRDKKLRDWTHKIAADPAGADKIKVDRVKVLLADKEAKAILGLDTKNEDDEIAELVG